MTGYSVRLEEPREASASLDQHASSFRKRIILLTASAVVLDGLDNQLLGFAIPAVIKDWSIARDAFAPILAASLLAMIVGTAFGGIAGDKLGRRGTLIGSLLVFALGTGLMSMTSTLPGFAALRLIAALGLGSTMPNATALLADHAPAHRRNLAISAGIVAVPVGGLLGGALAASLLPAFGWRVLFAAGGCMPLVVAAAMAVGLSASPSSPRAGTSLTKPSVALRAVFSPAIWRDTALLWLAFFNSLFAVYLVFNWAPTLLSGVGFGLRASSSGLASFNLGGVIAAIIGGGLMDRYGSRRPLIVAALLGGMVAAAIAVHGLDSLDGTVFATAVFGLLGAFVAGVQVMLFALAAHVYPVQARAAGVGLALAVGRLGAVLGAFAGATVLRIGVPGYFGAIAGAMAMATLAIALVSRHTSSARGT